MQVQPVLLFFFLLTFKYSWICTHEYVAYIYMQRVWETLLVRPASYCRSFWIILSSSHCASSLTAIWLLSWPEISVSNSDRYLSTQ